MVKIVCEACGSNSFTKQGDYFVCDHCGTKYSSDYGKNLIVTGTVKIDNSDKIDNLYKLARRAKTEENNANAAKYYEMILNEDPTSWEAAFYSVFFRSFECSISDIESTCTAISNCVETVLKLVREQVETEEQDKTVTEIGFRCHEISSMLYQASENHCLSMGNDVGNEY